MNTWPFDDPPNTAVVSTKQVVDDHQPILYVSHEEDEDGDSLWQFHPGINCFQMEDALIVSLGSILQLDQTLFTLADLEIGYYATRERVGAPWQRKKEA